MVQNSQRTGDVFRVKSPSEVILKESQFSLKDSTEKIEYPTLVCKSESDDMQGGQAKEFYDHLGCPKTFILFTSPEGAGETLSNGRLCAF